MISTVQKVRAGLLWLIHAFRVDQSGQILVIFSLSSFGIFAGLGAGIDLATAFAARQRLSEVATLACQYSTRPSVAQSATASSGTPNGFQTYVAAVNAFAASSLTTQHWTAATPTGPGGTAGAYFTATPAAGGTTAAGASPTNPTVEMFASVPTTFGRILDISAIPIHTKMACTLLGITPQVVNPPNLLQEGFEQPCSFVCFYSPTGSTSLLSTITNAIGLTASYVGYNGFRWYILGYCLETDHVGVVNATVPEGTHAAELDCDNGFGTKGNSSISAKLYLANGQYELRYYYRSRVDYLDYDPTYICGSTASDVAWANDANALVNLQPAVRTNQINVYLDANIAGVNGPTGSPPTHQTLDGTQYLGGSNLIDMCVYSPTWLERSVRIKVTTPGYYWLSFAADGTSDSYGGQLDNIRLCQELCAGPLQDNFPPFWLPANNSGVNKMLFEDTFDLPLYVQDYPYHYIAKSGNLNLSLGSSGNPFQSGWPSLAASGWATAPFNQVTYALNGAYQGPQYIALDGFNANGSPVKNRLISRPFLLDPGYYQVSYDYISMVNFANAAIVSSPCTAAPGSSALLGTLPTATGTIRYYSAKTTNEDTNVVAAFLANGQLISTPVGGGAQGSATSYANPDGSVSVTPTVAPDGFSRANYDATQVNPLIDFCTYSDGFAWVPRSVAVKITKPGLYWLSFSAQSGTADGDGGAIDDVKLTALGSPFMSNPPPSPLVVIPVPNPQPDTSVSPSTYAGYVIVADPLMPPGADQ